MSQLNELTTSYSQAQSLQINHARTLPPSPAITTLAAILSLQSVVTKTKTLQYHPSLTISIFTKPDQIQSNLSTSIRPRKSEDRYFHQRFTRQIAIALKGSRGRICGGVPPCFLSAYDQRGIDQDVGMLQGRRGPTPSPIQSGNRHHDIRSGRDVPHVPFPGQPIPMVVHPFLIYDSIPEDK